MIRDSNDDDGGDGDDGEDDNDEYVDDDNYVTFVCMTIIFVYDKR